MLEREQRVKAKQGLMFARDVRDDLRAVALGIAEHALRPFAVAKPEIFEVFAAKAELDRAKPEIPIFEAEPHALVKPGALFENRASDEAAGLADILLQMPQHRIFAGIVAVPLLSEHV